MIEYAQEAIIYFKNLFSSHNYVQSVSSEEMGTNKKHEYVFIVRGKVVLVTYYVKNISSKDRPKILCIVQYDGKELFQSEITVYWTYYEFLDYHDILCCSDERLDHCLNFFLFSDRVWSKIYIILRQEILKEKKINELLSKRRAYKELDKTLIPDLIDIVIDYL